MAETNPYAPPTSPPSSPSPPAEWTPGKCPSCGGDNLHKPSFTWWGGMLGPSLLEHHVCRGCGFGFNGKTGKSNSGAITTYIVITSIVAVAAGIGMYFAMH